MPNLVLLAEADGIATMVLNRPDKLNAFGDDMREQLIEALDAVGALAGVRALVITGAGRAFCAGGDIGFMTALKKSATPYEDGLHRLVDAGRMAISRLAALPFPTIAAVNGPAAGGGLSLAIACDLVVASDAATFGSTFVRIGLHVDWGGSYFLPRRVGLSKALELCWSGDMIDAAEALRIGLADRVWPHDRFADEVKALAARLAAAPRTSVRIAKRNLGASFGRTLEQCLAAEGEAQAACWDSPDSTEGILAFAEKRKAVFAGDGAAPEGETLSAAGLRFE